MNCITHSPNTLLHCSFDRKHQNASDTNKDENIFVFQQICHVWCLPLPSTDGKYSHVSEFAFYRLLLFFIFRFGHQGSQFNSQWCSESSDLDFPRAENSSRYFLIPHWCLSVPRPISTAVIGQCIAGVKLAKKSLICFSPCKTSQLAKRDELIQAF